MTAKGYAQSAYPFYLGGRESRIIEEKKKKFKSAWKVMRLSDK